MRFFYFTCALALFLAGPAVAQQTTATPKGTAYLIFLRGAPIGREDLSLREDATGITITVQGRIAAPFNVVTKRAELKYKPDWAPERFALEATASGSDVHVETSFANGNAITQGNQGATKIDTTHPVAAQSVILPNGVFSLYAALARRLATLPPNPELRAYI